MTRMEKYYENHKAEICEIASNILQEYVGRYSITVLFHDWMLRETGSPYTVIVLAPVVANGERGYFMFIGTILRDKRGKISDITEHFVELMNICYYNDTTQNDLLYSLHTAIKMIKGGENCNDSR